MTQCGFVRLSSNRSVFVDAVSPAEAVGVLALLVDDPAHEFWTDHVAVTDAAFDARKLQGHRQVTDLYLVSLAKSMGGKLVTLDAPASALDDNGSHIIVLESK